MLNVIIFRNSKYIFMVLKGRLNKRDQTATYCSIKKQFVETGKNDKRNT